MQKKHDVVEIEQDLPQLTRGQEHGLEVPVPFAVMGTVFNTLYIALLASAARGVDCNPDEDGINRLDDFPRELT